MNLLAEQKNVKIVLLDFLLPSAELHALRRFHCVQIMTPPDFVLHALLDSPLQQTNKRVLRQSLNVKFMIP
jgi:hypothetical protein